MPRDETGAQFLAQTYVYKGTRAVGDLVVKRKLRLYPGKFVTYHDFDKDAQDKKIWYLDHKCELHPKTADEITSPELKYVRAKGTWTITATVDKARNEVQHVYKIVVVWSGVWAAKGYTTCDLSFESQDEARKWHSLIQEQIVALREKALSGGRRSGRASLGNGVPSFSLNTNGGNDSMHGDSIPRSRGDWGPESFSSQQQKVECGTSEEREASDAKDEAGRQDELDQRQSACSVEPNVHVHNRRHHHRPTIAEGAGVVTLMDDLREREGGNSSDSDASHDDEDKFSDANDFLAPAGEPSQHQRWVPYKQTNGVAVYHHLDPPGAAATPGDDQDWGSEYMVTTVVRGPPKECLKVLMSYSANSTILGPVKSLEVLKRRTTSTDKDVLRMTLEASGVAGYVCAPRELVVERMWRTDEEGLYVVMFVSREPPMAVAGGCEQPRPADWQQGDTDPAIDAMFGRPSMMPPECPPTVSLAAGRGWRWWGGLGSRWCKPVRGWVLGSYTIAPLSDRNLDNSPESLVTFTVKVDMKGWFGEGTWLKPLSDLTGWTDAFLDGVLMAVTLIRDEVEYKRFNLQPLMAMLHTTKQAREPTRNFSQSVARRTPRQPSGPNSPPFSDPTSRFPSAQDADLSSQQLHSMDEGTERADAEGTGGPFGNAEDAAAAQSGWTPYVMDLEELRKLSTLHPSIWEDTHTLGKDAPFKVRGPTYLKDRKKIPAGAPKFSLLSMEVVTLEPNAVEHVARFLPSVRSSGVPFSLIINLVIPGTPLLGIIAVFASDRHPDSLGAPPRHPMEEEHNWQPFDFVLHRYMTGSTQSRNLMLKLIPHIADGSWMIKQSVGTTPVILGKQLRTTYHMPPSRQYLEVDIDISANNVAAYVTGLVRGATKSLVIDMGFVLEGTAPWELPESLLGTLRLNYLDLKVAKKLDSSVELPLKPPPPPRPQPAAAAAAPTPTLQRKPSIGGRLPPSPLQPASSGTLMTSSDGARSGGVHTATSHSPSPILPMTMSYQPPGSVGRQHRLADHSSPSPLSKAASAVSPITTSSGLGRAHSPAQQQQQRPHAGDGGQPLPRHSPAVPRGSGPAKHRHSTSDAAAHQEGVESADR